MLSRELPGQVITAVAIAGGPACNWERDQLYNNFSRKHALLELKQCGDVDDFEAWLRRKNFTSTDFTAAKVPPIHAWIKST